MAGEEWKGGRGVKTVGARGPRKRVGRRVWRGRREIGGGGDAEDKERAKRGEEKQLEGTGGLELRGQQGTGMGTRRT